MDLSHPKFMTSATILVFTFLDGDVPCRPSYGVYIVICALVLSYFSFLYQGQELDSDCVSS